MNKKKCEVKITRDYDQFTNKWIVRVSGITSGFVVDTTEDDSSITFKFDADRFEPVIVKRH